MKFFETIFLEDAKEFVSSLDKKTAMKVFYNIDLAENMNDPKLFKKLNLNIWEFRTNYQNKQIRLLAFWDKTNNKKTLVIACNGFVKKESKIPKREIEKAEQIRQEYLDNKNR